MIMQPRNIARKIAAVQCVALAVLLIALLLTPYQAGALVNPETLTSQSPEDLVVEVLESQVMQQGNIEIVRVRAKVLDVRSSESGLKPGGVISIVYRRDLKNLKEIKKWFKERADEPGWAGDTPSFLPAAPEAGATLRTYIRQAADDAQKTYAPAANQYSFEPAERIE